jgi:hypothetical protein
MRFSVSVALALAFLSGCSSIENKVVTRSNATEIMAEATKKLPTDKAELLRKALFDAGEIPSGMTVAQLIEQQRKLDAEEAAEKVREDKLAAEENEKSRRMLKQMRESLIVTLYDAQPRGGNFPYLAARFAYKNTSGKSIRAFEGKVAFNDVLGNRLCEIDLNVLVPVKAGATGEKLEELFFDPYGELRDKKFDDLKIEWRPSKILFADGTVESEWDD